MMHMRNPILSLVISLLILSSVHGQAAGLPSGSAQFEVIRQAAEKYVNRGKPTEILAKDLHALMLAGTPYGDVKYYNPTLFNGPWIIDVRTSESGELPDPYFSGHIPGAVNVPWRQIADVQILRSLPRDRPIVVYSDTGLIGAQVTTILNILGI